MKLLPVVSFVILVAISCSDTLRSVKSEDKHIEYMGRVGNNSDGSKEIYWSGSSIKLNFIGTEIQAVLKDEKGLNYFNVILDGDSIFILKPDTVKSTYTLFSKLEKGEHSVEIYKRTEWSRGKTNFYGFTLPNGKTLAPSPNNGRRIEFYGNSITCGYGIEDFSGNDSPDSIYTNHYLTYAALTARHFGAKMSSISHSGIGIMVSWYPSNIYDDYDKLNPADSTSLWDFSKDVPQLVVINLFQNDSWIVHRPEIASFKKYFGAEAPSEKEIIEAYKKFVKEIRSKYDDAEILCVLGSMDITKEGSPWPGYVKQAVSELNDNKVRCYFMPYKDSPGHPRVDEQKVMADSLISFIERNIDW